MLTIGFSPHYIEALPFIRQQVARHNLIILEEPPSANFSMMLNGSLSVEDYLMEIDSEFPEFDLKMCGLLREFHSRHRQIVQIEPYLERLLQIHEHFAAGKTPADIVQQPQLKDVYAAEKVATAALINYYAMTTHASFHHLIDAVKIFARADANRLSLRQRLRASAIATIAHAAESIYVEAGYIHYPLYQHLRRELAGSAKIRIVFLLQPIIHERGGKRRNLGPGDLLTLHYFYHRNPLNPVLNVLAARSLIYVKLIPKEELHPNTSIAPHTEEEIKINRMVDQFDFEDCAELFSQIQRSDRNHALQTVKSYLNKSSLKF